MSLAVWPALTKSDKVEAAGSKRQGVAVATTSAMLNHVSGIVCSLLAQAKETSEIVSRLTGLPLTLVNELKECRLGVFEGQAEESL
ncbi:histidine phosphatase family protein [Phaeobacter sp. S60]|uniref:histidine phosphatase family protein n=1 Tax=Phaeobacter sp. S60 TaxID=1569353 RepID=UPI00267EAF75